MYVDKKLGGVGAVQTLSRLNRTARGKIDTVILDFVNEWEEIQKAFQDYYQVTYLEEEADPNKLYTLKTQLEQLYVFAKSLNRKLPKRTNQLPYEIQDCVDLDSFRIQETFSGYIPLTKQNGHVKPIGTETRGTYKKEFDFLSHIIKTLNDAYGANLTDDDKVDIQGMQAKIEAHGELRTVMNSDNTEANIRYKFEKVMDEILLDFVNTKLELYKKLSDAQINTVLKKRWFEDYYRQRRAI